MYKLIYHDSFDTTANIGASLIEDPRQLSKAASELFGDMSGCKPDKDHVGIHLVALGDFEHYGQNRNGDGFPKKACIKYHDTFVKNGHVYRHHRNTDPTKSLGNIVKSAYNEKMGRVELIIHAHKDKAHDELERLAKEGEIPFSMACKVAFDRCNICDAIRTSSKDPNQCEHIRDGLGKMGEDGKVACTHNDEPKFFDISFVGRPADRIAWNLKVAADQCISSVKLAEAEAIEAPDILAIETLGAIEKLDIAKKLAAAEDHVLYALNHNGRPTLSDQYMREMAKAAAYNADTGALDALRAYDVDTVLYTLAKRGCVLNPESFFKYALGPDYAAYEEVIQDVRRALPGHIGRLLKQARCWKITNNTEFDVGTIPLVVPTELEVLVDKIANTQSVLPECAEPRSAQAAFNSTNVKLAFDNTCEMQFNSDVLNTLVEKYAAYKLAAVKALIAFNNNTNVESILAVTAAQNLV
jgi:hypothetical protein